MNPLVGATGAVLHRVLAGRATTRLTVVGWHRVDDRPGGLSTTVDELRRHLDVIDRDGWQVVSWPDAVLGLAANSLGRKALALTFDDGYASVADAAWPLLRERGWPATLFAVSGHLGPAARFPWDDEDGLLLSPAGLRDLAADGMHVGSHTVSHRWLPHLDPRTVAAEVTDSRAALEDLLGTDVTDFAYPMGGWSPAVRDAVAAAGYRSAVTVDRGSTPAGHDPFAIRRAFAPRGATDVARTLSGAYTFLRPLDAWRSRKGPAW